LRHLIGCFLRKNALFKKISQLSGKLVDRRDINIKMRDKPDYPVAAAKQYAAAGKMRPKRVCRSLWQLHKYHVRFNQIGINANLGNAAKLIRKPKCRRMVIG
jgi:hypothetical protein